MPRSSHRETEASTRRPSRRGFLTAAGAAATISLAGCAGNGASEDETTTLQANSPAAEGSVHGDAAAWLGEVVSEETGGEIEIEAFRNSELGGQIESIENVSTGGLDMYVIPYALTGTQYPPAQVFDAPYMYDPDNPYEDIYEATDPTSSEAVQEVIENLASEANIRSIGSVVQGTRRVTVTGDPATNPQELGEKLLRAVPIGIYEETAVGLGAQTTEIDFSEVPQALATGSIDGQENPYNIIVSSGIHENTDYVLETNHMHTPLAIILNEDLWQGFDDETQQIFYDAVEEIQPRATDLIEENIEGHREAVRNEGGQIIPPEELDMDAFRTQVRSHIREQFPDFIETIETIHGGEYR